MIKAVSIIRPSQVQPKLYLRQQSKLGKDRTNVSFKGGKLRLTGLGMVLLGPLMMAIEKKQSIPVETLHKVASSLEPTFMLYGGTMVAIVGLIIYGMNLPKGDS